MKRSLVKRLSGAIAAVAVALTGALAAMPAATADDGVWWSNDGKNRVWTLDELGGSISVTEFSYEGQPVNGTDFDGTPITGGVTLPKIMDPCSDVACVAVSYHVTIDDLSKVNSGDIIDFRTYVEGLEGQLSGGVVAEHELKTASGKIIFDYGNTRETQAAHNKFYQINSRRVLSGSSGLVVGEGVRDVDAGVAFDMHTTMAWRPDYPFAVNDTMGVFNVESGSIKLSRTFLKEPVEPTPTYPIPAYPSETSKGLGTTIIRNSAEYGKITAVVDIWTQGAANCLFDDSCVMNEEAAAKDMYGFMTITPTDGAKLTIAPNTLGFGVVSLREASEKNWLDRADI